MADPSSTRIRVLIVDDHQLIRDGLRMRIEREDDLTVCGEADDVDQALALLTETNPQVAIVDISLKTGNGLDLVRRILDSNPDVRIVVSSMHDEDIYAERALRAGAMGYVHKQEGSAMLIEAIRQILDGRLFASDSVLQKMLNRAVSRGGVQQQSGTPVDRLTGRELEVLERIGRGNNVHEIAQTMKLSRKTVETYRDRIRQKLHIDSAHELQHYAFRWVNDHN